MNTKTFEQFDVMTDAELAKVEGGNKCVNAIFGGALTGAGSGFVGGMATLGVTSIPGAFVGAHFGAIAGGCLGGMLLAWAGGPVTATGYAVVFGTAGAAAAYFN